MCFAAYVYNINRNDLPTWGRWGTGRKSFPEFIKAVSVC